jgi:hypothetical protein
VDGDGLADVMIGVQGSDEGGADSGRTAVFFGASIAGGGTFALSDADVTLLGAEADLSGRSVAGAGDVDGDGVPDLLIGGANLVAFGVSGADVLAGGTFDLDDVGTVFQASAAQGDVVLSVAAGGDLDGDGLEDLLITSANNLAVGLGKVCVFLGGGLLTGGVLSLEEADAVFYGTTGVAQLATGAGDVDGDGVDDVLVGSFSDHTAGSTAGATWVLFSPW